jgi:hypothetical protein
VGKRPALPTAERVQGGLANEDIAQVSCCGSRPCRHLCTDRLYSFIYLQVETGVNLIERQKGRRRMDLPVEFPLTDSNEAFVFHDRRRLHDRRKKEYGLDDLKIILRKMSN